ncbi:MAG TPA: hypothetical protein VF017_08040 [Thermoanaerobaculia bacterium]|nr:hypothetical protein [Thermoanaerobaculia bacterium]
MKEAPIQAVEMVRAIRDTLYEETKDLSRDELMAFFAQESAAMREEPQRTTGPEAPAEPAGKETRRTS